MEDSKILVIDIETTGFLNQEGSIVEVGIVSLDLRSGLIDIIFSSVCQEEIFCESHCKPPLGWIFENSRLEVKAVEKAPAFSDLKPIVQTIINNYSLGATAFNRDFDFAFLEDRGVQFPKKLPCPMLVATPICKCLPKRYGQYKWPKVEEAWQYFFPGVQYVEQHRGADDALHEALIVWELYQMGKFKVEGGP
jgi:DNA polymerase III epsilon subunit-like protein